MGLCGGPGHGVAGAAVSAVTIRGSVGQRGLKALESMVEGKGYMLPQ